MYQDAYRNGETIAQGSRECSRRYELVVRELRRVGAKTVLDLGAHDGYFSRRLSGEEGMRVTAVDDHPTLRGAEREGVQVVHKRVQSRHLQGLGRYDAVLALSVLHHFVDWRQAFEAARGLAHRVLVAEVPFAEERLRVAAAREQLRELHDVVLAEGDVLGYAPATRQPDLMRPILRVRPVLRGKVFAGTGHHSATQRVHGEAFEDLLGYRPYPGSLNLRMPSVVQLGEPQHVLARRVRRRDRMYRFWPARIEGLRMRAHIMIPDAHHGADTVEMLAPVHLRSKLDLQDGSSLSVEVDW